MADAGPEVLALFGPTAVGKTAVAIAVADCLREQGEDPVAVSCDALQVYRGIEVMTGAAGAEDQARLEHRLIGISGVDEEFSAGRFAELARAEIDDLRRSGRRPIVVGGTGLYLRAALSALELRPPVAPDLRAAVEADLADRGPAALHGELAEPVRDRIHPNDRKKVSRATELQRAGIGPHSEPERLWTTAPRVPTVLVGLTIGRVELGERVHARVEAMAASGAADEARRADALGASRTVRSAIGFREFLAGDLDAVERAHLAYARRQATWLRRLEGVHVIDRSGLDDSAVAERVCELLA